MKKAILKTILATLAAILFIVGYGILTVNYPRVLLVTSGILFIGLLARMFYEIFKPRL
jgi:hypothetical protein